MTKYFFKRLFFAFLAMFVLITIIMFLLSILINDYDFNPLGPPSDKMSTEQWNERLYNNTFHNYPILERYANWWRTLFTGGGFGPYYGGIPSQPLQDQLLPQIGNTVYISFVAFIFSTLIGYFFGFVAAIYRGKWPDTLVNVLSVLFISIPSFIVGVLLLKLAGVIGLPQSFMNFGSHDFNVRIFVLSSIMPVFSLIFGLASTLTYYVRNEVVEILSQDYIKTAQSKGVGTWRIIMRHILRNSFIPAFSILAPSLLGVIGGSIVLEQMFGVSGIAVPLLEATKNADYNVVIFSAIFFTGLGFLLSILMDMCYPLIDPRIRFAENSSASFYGFTKFALIRSQWMGRYRIALHLPNMTIMPNSPFERFLIDHQLIDDKTHTITFYNWCFERYGIDPNMQRCILRNAVYKVNVLPTGEVSK